MVQTAVAAMMSAGTTPLGAGKACSRFGFRRSSCLAIANHIAFRSPVPFGVDIGDDSLRLRPGDVEKL